LYANFAVAYPSSAGSTSLPASWLRSFAQSAGTAGGLVVVVGVALVVLLTGPGVPGDEHAATATAVAPNPAACKNARRLIAILDTS
jgi:hypothetical protein